MAWSIQLLPDAEELEVIKKALREFVGNAESNSPDFDIAWGILATIHKRERENADRIRKS